MKFHTPKSADRVVREIGDLPHHEACASKARREDMVQACLEIGRRYGAGAYQRPTIEAPGVKSRGILVTMELRDWRIMFEMNARSHVGAFLGHWHTRESSSPDFPADFPSQLRNPLGHKATICVDSFGEFSQALDSGLAHLARQP